MNELLGLQEMEIDQPGEGFIILSIGSCLFSSCNGGPKKPQL